MQSQLTPAKVNTDEGCGDCALCCKLLHIDPEPAVAQMTQGQVDFPEKPWNTWCKHCKPGHGGGCRIYPVRPQACVTFQCIYLQSLTRDDVPKLEYNLKPKVSHVVLMGSVQDNMVLFAHCDPAYPRAWRNEPMRSHLINVSNLGCTVIIVVGRDHYVMTKGRPTVKMTEEQALELSKNKFIKQGSDGQLHIGLLDSTVASTDSRLVPRPVPRADYDYDNKR